MCPKARRPFGPPTSSPSRSSIACARRAASSPWPSTGTPPPAWRICSACPTPPSPRIASIARSIACCTRPGGIENDLQGRLGTLFQLDYDLLLYDLTSTYFEGLAEDNDLAKRGYSRDHRSDCKQVVLALVVTREGFPLAHYTLAGNTQDVQTVEAAWSEPSRGASARRKRVWVMDRGMISDETLAFLAKSGRRYLLATRRRELMQFQKQLQRRGNPCPDTRTSR